MARFEPFRVRSSPLSSSFPFFSRFSFDLSLSPNVVWTLTPTIGRSLQGTGLALGAAEGAESPSTPCQPLNSSTVTSEAPNKLVIELKTLRVVK